MRVLLVTANDPLDTTGGAPRSIRRQLSRLAADGHSVAVLTYGETAGGSHSDGFSIYRINDPFPRDGLDSYLSRNDFDAVITQSLWGDIALWAARKHDVPVVLDAAGILDLTINSGIATGLEPDHVIAPSRFLKGKALAHFGCPITVVNPTIDFDYYTLDGMERETYTLINPIASKGGFLFERLAGRNQRRQFLAKMGWFLYRDDDLTWDTTMFEIIDESYDVETPIPNEPEFADVENVEYVRRGSILDVYRRTRVLLVPSVIPETFGRVVLEAMWNGIPVVASRSGGLPEACGGAGVVIDDYRNVEAWDRALSLLDRDDVYERYAEAGRERAIRYQERQPESFERFREALESVR